MAVVAAGSVAFAPASSAATAASKPAASKPAIAAPKLTPADHARVAHWSKTLKRIRTCESSGNYRINTGNGYYGAYQFAAATWHGLGYHGLPNQAAPAIQDAAAAKLLTRAGTRPWGACAR